MSRENVELVRRAIELLNERDVGSIEGSVTPDLEWRPILTAGGDLERPVYRGAAGIEQYWRDLDELFADTHVETRELEALDADHVLFGGLVTARGRLSGVPIEQGLWAVWEVRAGRLSRGTAYRTREEAVRSHGGGPAP